MAASHWNLLILAIRWGVSHTLQKVILKQPGNRDIKYKTIMPVKYYEEEVSNNKSQPDGLQCIWRHTAIWARRQRLPPAYSTVDTTVYLFTDAQAV